MATPNSQIRFLSGIDFKLDETLLHTSEQSQQSYMLSKLWQSVTNFKYVRGQDRDSFKVHLDRDSVMENSNYIAFINPNLTPKWYYAFIDEVRYINDGTCEVFYTIDPLQTYMFDMQLKACFVEREHVYDDSVGAHTVMENLDVGYYRQVLRHTESLSTLVVIVATAYETTDPYGSYGQFLGGTFSGVAYRGYRQASINDLRQYLANLDGDGQGDRVVSIFMMPLRFTPLYDGTVTDGEVFPQRLISDQFYTFSIDKALGNFEGYVPTNGKLYSYPYNFLRVINGRGENLDLKYEYFTTSDCQFTIGCDISPAPMMQVAPFSYKSDSPGLNNETYLTLGDYPQCSWTNNSYANWLGQSRASNTLNAVSSLGALGAGIATSNPLAIAGGIYGVAQTVGEYIDKSKLPDVVRGTTSGASNIVMGKQNFEFINYKISGEYAKIIDEYFSRYGYKVNRFKVPESNTRVNWNYVKTRDASIYGNIPNNMLEQIREIFDNGVTYWHTDNVGDYSLSNPVNP